MKKITVVVLSGPPYAGKSTELRWLRSLPEYKKAHLVEMDKIREEVFGERRLTRTGQVFKNEATRDALKALIVGKRPCFVFVEMSMMTKRKHQKPMVAMLAALEKTLNRIACEEAARDGKEKEKYKVVLKVILLYCELAAALDRVPRRLKGEKSRNGSDVLDLASIAGEIPRFEYPTSYTPLLLDTSDESPTALKKRRQKILRFLKSRPKRESKEFQRKNKGWYESTLREFGKIAERKNAPG